jgi:hypothetical protein
LARYWRTLTGDQQAANNAVVGAYPYTDKYGNTRYFSGYQLLLRSNINRAVSGLEPISEVPATPPAGFNLTAIVGFSEVGEGVDNDLGLVWTSPEFAPTDYIAQIFAGNQVSPGISNYTGAYLLLGSVDAGEGEFAVDQSTFAPLAFFVAGNAVFAKIVVVHGPSGIEVSSYVTKIIIENF